MLEKLEHGYKIDPDESYLIAGGYLEGNRSEDCWGP